MRCSTNVYLFFLAAVDMVFLLFNFILSLAHYPHLKRAKYELYWRLFGIFVWLTDGSCKLPGGRGRGRVENWTNLLTFAAYSSIYLTVSFTVERYIAVCHPIRGQALCTESRAKKVIAGLLKSILLFFIQVQFPVQFLFERKKWRFPEIIKVFCFPFPVHTTMSTVVIILCFLLTGTTSFEYMLNSYERFEDVLTGLPCDPSANIANLTRSEFEESLRDILRTQNKTEVKSQCVKVSFVFLVSPIF